MRSWPPLYPWGRSAPSGTSPSQPCSCPRQQRGTSQVGRQYQPSSAATEVWQRKLTLCHSRTPGVMTSRHEQSPIPHLPQQMHSRGRLHCAIPGFLLFVVSRDEQTPMAVCAGDTLVVDGAAWMWREPAVPRKMVSKASRGVEAKSRALGVAPSQRSKL